MQKGVQQKPTLFPPFTNSLLTDYLFTADIAVKCQSTVCRAMLAKTEQMENQYTDKIIQKTK